MCKHSLLCDCEITGKVKEQSTTAGVPGYGTTRAFDPSKGTTDFVRKEPKQKEKSKGKIGEPFSTEYKYKKGKLFDRIQIFENNMLDQINEISYRQYMRQTDATPKQKINNSLKEMKKKVREIEQIARHNIRLKNEMDVNSGDYWKSTSKHLNYISEKLIKVSNQLKELGQ